MPRVGELRLDDARDDYRRALSSTMSGRLFESDELPDGSEKVLNGGRLDEVEFDVKLIAKLSMRT